MNINVTAPEDATEIDLLAERYRAAFAKVKGGRAQWIDGTLELVIVVKEAREFHRDHRDYHRWLERNELREISKQDLSALNQFADDLVFARQLLEQTKSWSWQQVWRERPGKSTLTGFRKGRNYRVLDASGSTKRKRQAVIPTVMREDYEPGMVKLSVIPRRRRQPRAPASPPPPERKAVSLRALTKEQVDPDFKGTHLEFITKYGHVNLHTKDELEHHKNQEALMAWLGLLSDHAKTAQLLTAAIVDPVTLREWMAKPAKAEKLRAWCNTIEQVCKSIGGIVAMARPISNGSL